MDAGEQQSDDRSDEELVDAVNGGTPGAFDVLYHRHRDWVANLAFRFVRDRDLALDVLQETFVYLAGKFPGFRITAKLRTFLYPAVRNLALSVKKKSERLQTDQEEAIRSVPAQASAAADVEIFAALGGISDEQREVLLLRFIDGFQLNEIAGLLEVPVGTVKSRLHNALTTLRKDPRTKKLFGQ